MELSVNAFAKINLFLDISAKLPNGYHSLFMIMQSVSLCDTLRVSREVDGISLTCSDASLPTDSGNLAVRAAEAFFRFTGIRGGAGIHIEKRIPLAAGLAGGSADAAGVIFALDALCNTKLSQIDLGKIGASVGSDVPFCLSGGTMLAQDTGTVLSPLPALRSCFIVLAKPAMSVSTAQAYSDFDSAGYVYRPDAPAMLHAAATADFDGMCRHSANVFEQTVEVSERVELRTLMSNHGSLMTRMTGSGPTVFGIFNDESAAISCANEAREKVRDVFVCTPVASGVEII